MDGLGYISTSGFKCFRSIEDLSLGTMTVLFGLNGSGKSSFIRLFAFLNAIRDGLMTDFIMTSGRAQSILHYGPSCTDSLTISVRLLSGKLSYGVEMFPKPDNTLAVRHQRLETQGIAGYPDGPIVPGEDALQPMIRKELHWSPALDGYISLLFDGHQVYNFFDTDFHSPMKRASNLHDNRYLRPDGANIAAFLYLLRHKHPDAYHGIIEAVRSVAPFFSDFALEPDKLNRGYIRLQWKPVAADVRLDVSTLSEGILRFIAVATLFLQPTEYRPAMIVLDEPEFGFHPGMYPVLGALIKRALVDTRVVVATKSPALIRHLAPEEVVLAEWLDGAVVLTSKSYSDAEAWLQAHGLIQWY